MALPCFLADEAREVLHAVEDVMGTGLAEALGGHQFGEAEYVHAGGNGAGDADGAVFDDGAARWIIESHRARGVQVDVGVGFATLDVAGAEDIALDIRHQPGFTERHFHLDVRAAGCDAIGLRQGLQDGFDTVDGLYGLFQGIINVVLVAQIEFGWWRLTDHRLDFLQALRARVPDKGVEHIIEGEFQAADFVKHAREHFVGNALTVDQHAVAVEDDQVK